MKTIIKIEIVLLVLALLVGAGMVLVSEGYLELLYDPVVVEAKPVPIATDGAVEPLSMEEPEAAEDPETTVPTQETVPEDASQEETKKEETRKLTAKKYFAYDIREGTYLMKKGKGSDKLYPASITKLLTAYVVLQHMKPGDTVEVGDAMKLVAWDSSVAGLKEGDKVTVEQLVAAMMLPSGNDAAQTAAVATGRAIAGKNIGYQEAVDVFMKEMNKQAKAIGMKNSHFVSPDGYHHDQHYTTMDDLVALCKKVLTNETILKYTSRAKDAVILPDRTLEWKNTNALLHPGNKAYLSNTIGLKTGFTSKAGNCLVTAFFEPDRIILVGVFGCPARTDDRYLDTVAIYNSI